MKMKRGRFVVAVVAMLALVLGSVGQAQAVVITFDPLPPGLSLPFPTFGSFSTNGFTFTAPGPHGHVVPTTFTCGWGGCAWNGTNIIGSDNAPPEFTMAPSAGGTFSLHSFDGAEFVVTATQNATQIDLTGTLSGGGILNTSFLLDGVNDSTGPLTDFQHFVLPPAWTNLVSVKFAGSGTNSWDWFAADNISVTVIPEPATLLLLGSGLLGLGAWRRRRSSS